MPEHEYWLDNFFQKMTDLESPRKNNDCYFYYYSTCTKGDNCTFRHEPSALGCETTCSFWKEGKCINVHCNFRHMELRKNRKSIPCYWESQPSGCKKPHCPFMHTSQKANEEKGNPTEPTEPDTCNKQANQEFGSSVVDPLVVNFEEESDNECTPNTNSPQKASKLQKQQRLNLTNKAKTLEECELERIQAETAAYYSYPEGLQKEAETSSLRDRILKRLGNKEPEVETNLDNVQVLSLDEIRKRKRQRTEQPTTTLQDESTIKKAKVAKKIVLKKPTAEIDSIRIKSLQEIKAERKRKFEESNRITSDASNESAESEVSSTSKGDLIPKVQESSEPKVQCLVAPVQRELPAKFLEKSSDVGETDKEMLQIEEDEKKIPSPLDKDDEFLLEEDDFESSSISTMRAEEDILKDIDNILNE